MNAGIVLRADNAVAREKARKMGVAVTVSPDWGLPWSRTLFLAPEIKTVPWSLLAAGFRFLEHWDAAAPLVGGLAQERGSKEERARTQQVTLDLRLLVYEPGLLFVRDSAAGRALVQTWRAECAPDGDEKLAFLRALAIVKPTFNVLPRTWLAEEKARAEIDARSHRSPRLAQPAVLVTVEIAPGRSVKCRQGEEEAVKRHYQQLMDSRARRQR